MTKNNGFTLIELLLYVAIAALVLLAASLFLASVLESRVKNQTIAEVEQQGFEVMQRVRQIVRNAEAITSPAQGASAAALSVTTTIAGNNPTIFDLSSGAIRMKEGAAPVISLTNARVIASALTFQNLSRTGTPGTIRVQLTLTHTNSEGRSEYAFTKIFTGSATLRQP